MARYGCVEAGGTKFICAVANEAGNIESEVRIPTTTPEETLGQALRFFQAQHGLGDAALRSLGVACFGPVDLQAESPTYGMITATPKAGWRMTPVVRFFQEGLGIPVGFDTDVNGAALAEGVWGAGKGLQDFVYVTIGTGIGGGAVVGGRAVHGAMHPEMGHMRIPHDRERDPFAGICPFHGDCWEGLCSGPALRARFGEAAENWPEDHPGWDLAAEYTALAVQNILCTLSPQRILLGGGVMQQARLFPMLRQKTAFLLNGYLSAAATAVDLETVIMPPALGSRAGILGGLVLALRAAGVEV